MCQVCKSSIEIIECVYTLDFFEKVMTVHAMLHCDLESVIYCILEETFSFSIDILVASVTILLQVAMNPEVHAAKCYQYIILAAESIVHTQATFSCVSSLMRCN